MKFISIFCLLLLTILNIAVAQVNGGLPPITSSEQQKFKMKSNLASKFKPYEAFAGVGYAGTQMYVKQFRTLSKEDCLPQSRKGDPDALFCLYVIHRLAKEHDSAFPYALKSAELGNPVSQYETFNNYKNGFGTPKNLELAFYWKTKCAELKFSACELGLGWDYMDEKSTLPIDYSKAMRLNLAAYEHGDAEGASNVGMLYELGWGVPKDYAVAINWYKKAILGNGSSGQAETRLANLLSQGLGTSKDTEEARRLLQYVIDGKLFRSEYKNTARLELEKLH
jgi:TPR repeat protein